MPNHRLKLPSAAALSFTMVLSVAQAQPPATERAPDTASTVPQAVRKSPVAAALLSLAVPFGTGSFYAEHPAHGLRHLVIGLASIGAMGAGNRILSRNDDDGRGWGLTGVGALGYLVNWIIGIAVAEDDAQTYNRGLAPSLPAAPTPSPSQANAFVRPGSLLQVQLFSLRF